MNWHFIFRWFNVVVLDLTLAGDNAVVFAMAVRRLPSRQQFAGFVLGAIGAVVVRVIFTLGAVELLHFPAVRLIGGALLIWIAIKLLRPKDAGHPKITQGATLIEAIRIIILADLVMSTDNILAIAAASAGRPLLVIFGLGLSIPIVVGGAAFIATLMNRYGWIVYLGAGILGEVAGKLIVEDNVTEMIFGVASRPLEWTIRIGVAAAVVVIGFIRARRS